LRSKASCTVERITARGIVGIHLVTTERGERLTYDALQGRFRKARAAAGVDFQFRDLRAKAATDLENLDLAQKLLGHSGREMTEHYSKRRAGERVKPVDRKILPDE
jgi:integrase